MAWEKKKQKQTSDNGFSSDALFAKVTLSDAHKEDFYEWCGKVMDDIEVVLNDFCNAGYRVSIRLDLNNRAFMSSVTQQYDDHIHGGVIVTSRSNSAWECLLMGLYKVLELYPEDAFPTSTPHNQWG